MNRNTFLWTMVIFMVMILAGALKAENAQAGSDRLLIKAADRGITQEVYLKQGRPVVVTYDSRTGVYCQADYQYSGSQIQYSCTYTPRGLR